MNNKKIKLTAINEDGKEIKTEIENKPIYVFYLFVSENMYAISRIETLKFINRDTINCITPNSVFLQLSKGAKCCSVIEEANYNVSFVPKWTKKIRMFASYSRWQIEDAKKKMVDYCDKKSSGPIDSLLYEI